MLSSATPVSYPLQQLSKGRPSSYTISTRMEIPYLRDSEKSCRTACRRSWTWSINRILCRESCSHPQNGSKSISSSKTNTESQMLPPLSPTLSTTLKVIDATLKQTSNIKMGLLYLYKIYGKHHSSNLMPCLQVFEHVLNLLDQEPDLLRAKSTTAISETDYIAYIWLPLFRKLFHAGTNIQIKTGETVFPFSAASKQQLYPGASNVTGFKIDLRFVVRQDDSEFDVCSIEACCNSADDDKIIA